MMLPQQSAASNHSHTWMRTVTFPGRFESLPKISEFVVQAAKDAGLNPKAVYAVDLAVDEACTNIIEHAYGGEGHGDILCTCDVTGDGLTVTLQDHGKPFDPSKIRPPKPASKLSDIKPGGAGIFLMKKMMDEVRFEFSPASGNMLILIKRRKS